MSIGRGSSEERQELSRSTAPRRITVPEAAANRFGGTSGGAAGSRILGRPSPLPGETPHAAAEETDAARVRPGFELGNKRPAVSGADEQAQKASRRKLMIGVGVGIVLVLFLLMLLMPAGEKGAFLTSADQEMMRQYRDYLIQYNQHPQGSDIETRIKDVERHLKAYRWAASVGEKKQAEREFDTLLLMDSDRNSPLYSYCVKKLSRK